ncbi:hypothetical protein MNB_SV-6-707 [hydrothermal vent metagenome]|uniref:Prepilin-type N-terminal cleavage/methylation domain-containing protein n=1 Tax=hydrothermal vent metagenome TaxID=652676 RepID=A0A1W1BUI1_9ZZZZ
MLHQRKGFTLIELLISIALLSLVLMALYKSLNMLQSSNDQLFEHLQKAESQKRAMETLFLDIAGSDGNMTIERDEFSRLCLESSINSLYGYPSAKVCWVVSKDKKSLLRSEGQRYTLPLNSDDVVAVDRVMDDMDIFQIYRSKGEVLVLMQQKSKTPITFIVYGVAEKPEKKKPQKLTPKPKKRATPPPKKKKEILGPPIDIDREPPGIG